MMAMLGRRCKDTDRRCRRFQRWAGKGGL